MISSDLKWQIAAFVKYYNPAERGDIITLERKEIKRETIRKRPLLHREAAAPDDCSSTASGCHRHRLAPVQAGTG